MTTLVIFAVLIILILAGVPVAIGMGLTAADVVKTLTIGRGGKFENGKYIPSGKEPFIILGSRLGLPYSARAHNQKTDQYKGKILTPEKVLKLSLHPRSGWAQEAPRRGAITLGKPRWGYLFVIEI